MLFLPPVLILQLRKNYSGFTILHSQNECEHIEIKRGLTRDFTKAQKPLNLTFKGFKFKYYKSYCKLHLLNIYLQNWKNRLNSQS